MANGIANAPPKAPTPANSPNAYAPSHETRPAPPPPATATATAKNGKGKQKKVESDQELLLKKINELELSKRGEKGETEELGMGALLYRLHSLLGRFGRAGMIRRDGALPRSKAPTASSRRRAGFLPVIVFGVAHGALLTTAQIGKLRRQPASLPPRPPRWMTCKKSTISPSAATICSMK